MNDGLITCDHFKEIFRASHISVSMKGTFWYLSLFFLEWSTFHYCYFSRFALLGFTIRTVRRQKISLRFLFFLPNIFPSQVLGQAITQTKLSAEAYVREGFFDRNTEHLCMFKSSVTKHKFLCLMASLRSLPAFLPPRNDPQESSLGYITKICSSSNVIG